MKKLTFVKAPFEVLQVPKLLVCWHSTFKRRDLFPEPRPNLRAMGKLEEHVAEQTGSCVTAGKKNVDQFVANADLVVSLFDQLFNEDITLIVDLARGLLGLVFPYSLVNELVYVCMANFQCVFAFLIGAQEVEDAPS